jgi:PAS domain S-box-containing protein
MADEDRLAQRAILQRMFEASVDGVSVMDLATQSYIMVNPAKLAMMGYTKEEYLALNPLDTIMDIQEGGRDKHDLAQEHLSILSRQGYHSGQLLLRRKDGSPLICSVSSQHIDHLGQSMLVTFIRPIADKVLIETKMREAQLLKDALLDNSFDGLLLYNMSVGKWVVANQTIALLTGYDQEVVLQMPIDKLFVEDSKTGQAAGGLLHHTIGSLAPGGRSRFLQKVCRVDGHAFTAEVNVMRLEAPENHLAVVAIKDISKSIELSRQLEETRNKFQGLFEHSVLGLLTMNQESTIQMVNTTLCRVLQREKKDLVGLSFGEFLYGKEAGKDKVFQINDLIVQKKGFALERGYTLPDGHHIWLRFRSRPLYEASVGEFTVLTAVEDITERKHMTDRLVLSESKLKEAAGMAKLAHWTLDYKLKVFSPSKDFYELLELAPDMELGYEVWMGHVAPEDRERVLLNWEEALASHRPLSIEYDLITNRGKRKHVQGMYKVVLDTVGEVDQVFGIVQDITDKRVAMEALAVSETRFRRLAENSPNVMFKLRVHPEIAIEYASPAVEHMFGYSVHELLSPNRFQEFRL